MKCPICGESYAMVKHKDGKWYCHRTHDYDPCKPTALKPSLVTPSTKDKDSSSKSAADAATGI